MPVANLSGGEQARLLLAQLMLQESDIILFDEPTNDLDIATLEVLEESFCEFPGAIVLVTHDRYLLDRASTNILGLSPSGGDFFASYLQWEEYFAQQIKDKPAKTEPAKQTKTPINLNQSQKKELKSIESKIIKAEKELEALNKEMALKNASGDIAEITRCCKEIANQQSIIDSLYARWEELEKV